MPGSAPASGERRETGEHGPRDASPRHRRRVGPLRSRFVLEAMALEAGEVIATGTPSGVGRAREPPVWPAPGDRREVEVEGMGALGNRVADEPVAAAARAGA